MQVYGAFEGRSPCQEIAKQLNLQVSESCWKAKWSMVLYADPVTSKPAAFEIKGSIFKDGWQGKWSIIRGMPANTNATIFELKPENDGRSLFLLKADENVLFILDQRKNLMVGNTNFSYTLNRVVL